ncbi:MAG: type II secretion system protein [Bacillota bacterium]|nr:type II secretion system protein [Bacillota bacterium]
MVGITINIRSNKKLYLTNQKGFTLLEVLASLVLLGILSTSIVAIFIPAANWVQQARQQTTATNFAATVLENLRADPTQVKEENDEQTVNSQDYGFDEEMTATINIGKYDDPLDPDDNLPLFTVSVTVTDDKESELLPGGLCTVMRGEDS